MLMGYLRKLMPHLAAERVQPGHNGMLQLLEARRGRGKSYTLMWFARAAVDARVPVYANFGVDRYRLALQSYMRGCWRSPGEAFEWVARNVHYVSLWDQVLVAEDSVILLDEASRIFDSRQRGKVPAVALEWLQQSRKLKLTIVLASQSFDWLDVRVRQLADTLWLTRKETDKRTGLPTTFHSYGLDPWAEGLTEVVIRNNAHSVMSIPFDLNTAQLYDSWQIIAMLSGVPSWETMGELADHLGREYVVAERDWLARAIEGRSRRVPAPGVRVL